MVQGAATKSERMNWLCDEHSDLGKLPEVNRIMRGKTDNTESSQRAQRIEVQVPDANTRIMDKLEQCMKEVKNGIIEEIRQIIKNHLANKKDLRVPKGNTNHSKRRERRKGKE